MKIKSILQYLISFILALILLFYAFRNVNLEEFFAKLGEVKYSWVILSIFLSIISHWLRAYRWNILLATFQNNLSTGRTFLAIMTGYLANLAFPRLGEVIRCGVLKKTEKIPMSISFGTIITERIIDFVTLMFIIVFNLIIEFNRVFHFVFEILGFQKIIDNKYLIISLIPGFILLGLLGFFLIKTFINKKNNSNFVQKTQKFAKGLIEGLFSLKKIKNINGFIWSTAGMWVLYFFMGYVVIFAIKETSTLSILAGFTILSTGGLAMTIPVQGGIGTYHTFITTILVLYGIDKQAGLFFATLLHTSQIFSVIIFGSLSVLITVFISKKLRNTT